MVLVGRVGAGGIHVRGAFQARRLITQRGAQGVALAFDFKQGKTGCDTNTHSHPDPLVKDHILVFFFFFSPKNSRVDFSLFF